MANFFLIPTIPPPLPPPPRLFSLYAGDLHSDVTKRDLYILFSMIGPVHNVHLCRDPFSFKSLCYAFIDFYSPFHAADALNRFNHVELRGKPMRVMWVQRDPFLRKIGIGNLFVKNLDSSVHDAKLQEVFGVFGMILSCKVARDDDGKSKGFGFVQFCSEDSASDALSALNGSFLHGKILTVAKFLRKSERKEPQFTNVYVKNLDKDFTESSLKDTFSKYGKITSALIMNDAEGKSRGFGFVNFESYESALKAIEGLNGAEIGTKKWFVGKAMMKAQREAILRRSQKKQKPNVSNLFVRNLATFVTEKDLKQVFGAFGNVTFVKVICDKIGVSKGMAYICFSRSEEAKKAIAFLNGCFYNGKYMNVSLALHKEEYAKHLQTLLAFRSRASFAYKVPNLHKFDEKKVQKEDPAKEANSCDGDLGGFVFVDKSPCNSEWDV
ncbi:hypothetical protein L1987_45276 [Smallanthus sonchifolius]|uniref:Uncharacterized protein n=1 Tax=Smallanthus sonchifolius TaxID=185202 RepID=A0ACB9GSU1_9ASTR|nr:hypothetical protein L1987_45276 [Smallanthus sonchifolius]